MGAVHVKALSEERFVRRIKLRGEEEAKRIIAEAEERVKQIIEEAKEMARAEALKEADKIMQEAEERSSMIKQIAEAQARLTYRLRILQEKNEVIKQVFEKAMERLEEFISSADYGKVLERLIVEAAVSMGGGDLRVVLPKPYQVDLKAVAKMVEEATGNRTRLELLVEAGGFSGGVLVMTKDGRVVFDNTFEGRMKRMRKDLVKEVSLILFPREK